jgi:hypothetical protein
MLKGTDFPHKESGLHKRPPGWERAALSGQGQGGMLGFPVDLAGRRESLSCALQPRRLSEINLKPVAFALIPAGHFSAGVAEMPLNVGLFDLGGGGKAGAERMAAEREPPFALGKVAAQAGGEGACLHQPDDVLVGEALQSDATVLAGDRPE